MRAPVLAVTASIALIGAASAEEVFGSGAGCQINTEYGIERASDAGGTINVIDVLGLSRPVANPDDVHALASSEIFVGEDFTCEFASSNCYGEGDEWQAKIEIEKAERSITVSIDDAEPLLLSLCP